MLRSLIRSRFESAWKKSGLFSATGIIFGAIVFSGIAGADDANKVNVPPVVGGFTAFKDAKGVDESMKGELLLNELNCVACHNPGPQSRLQAKGAPDLSAVGSRITPQYLRDYLLDPHGMKPGNTMPDVFHASEANAKAGAVDFLVHFLASQGGPMEVVESAAAPETVNRGRELFHTVGCVACHAPEDNFKVKEAGDNKPADDKAPDKKPADEKTNVKPVEPKSMKTFSAAILAAAGSPSIPLGNLAEKTTVDAMTKFLVNPSHERPSGRMPSMNLTEVEARAIAMYLLREQLDLAVISSKPLPGTGINFEFYEGKFTSAAIEKFQGLEPKSKGRVKNFTLDIPNKGDTQQYGIKFSGWITLPVDGKYSFLIESDDGAMLYIDSTLVVNNDGIHTVRPGKRGEIELKKGQHMIDLTYFQNGGTSELAVKWQGPDMDTHAVATDMLAATTGKAMVPTKSEPFQFDAGKAKMGGQMFSMLGCASCHEMKNNPPMRKGKALAELNLDSPEGCLGEKIAKARPNYRLSAEQNSAIKTAVKNIAALNTPYDAATKAQQTMASMNCFACHSRNGIGGVSAARNELFVSSVNVELGDDGRIPPLLTGVGEKLLPAAIERILFKQELRVRSYLATRMPSYHQPKIAELPKALVSADTAGHEKDPVARVIAGQNRLGLKLVGAKGLGCVNCHGAKGSKSMGVPGPDMATMFERVTPGWYLKWLSDPNKLVPGTRMPAFWSEGVSTFTEVHGGKFDQQANAIWSFLSQGKEMQLPVGLRMDDNDELHPTDEVIVVRAFVTGVGPRSVLVGTPANIHWVFDANTMRLAKVWRGKFFDAGGVWEQRGGRERPPLGTDLIDMPAGPAFAFLDSAGANWPLAAGAFDRNIGGKFKGYTIDKKGHPTFKYTLKNVDIDELEIPVVAGEKSAIVRKFQLSAATPVKDLFLQIAAGKKITAKEPGSWLVDDKVTYRLIPAGGAPAPSIPQTEIRDGKDGMKMLLLPVGLTNNKAEISVEVSW